MSKITYENKETIFESSLPNKNKVTAENMNEIKNAVNKLTAVKYCTCTTAANVQTKEFVITDGTQLETGDILCVKHSNSNTFSYNATNLPQASVNGTTYLVKRNEASPTGTTTDIMGAANNYIYYLFDGEKLAWLGHSNDNNTTYSNPSLGQGYGTCSTAESTVAKVVALSSYSLVNGGIVAVKFTNAVPANATMNVNNKGAKEMWYKGAKITAGVIKAGDLATFIYDGTRYQMISLDSGTGSGSADTLPIGSIFDYDGTTVPSGYEEVSSEQKTLWTNPNPNSAFAPQTIMLASSDYDMYEVIYKRYTNQNLCLSQKSLKGYGAQLIEYSGYDKKGGARNITYVNDTTLSVATAYYENTTGDNNYFIPIKIIGYKLGE